MSNGITSNVFGAMSVDFLYTADSLQNIGRRSNRWQIIDAFLRASEGNADRIAAGASGMILLVGVPGRPNTGAFYLYEENTRSFFTITFDGQETFHALNFDIAMMAYDLHKFLDIPKAEAVASAQKVRPQQKQAGSRGSWHRRRHHQHGHKGNSVRNNAHVVYSHNRLSNNTGFHA
jgi:hypothetical protein